MSDPDDADKDAVSPPPVPDQDDRPRPRYGELRPRPQYGEYASPEEQRASIKDPKARDQVAPIAPVVPSGTVGEHFGPPGQYIPPQHTPPQQRWAPLAPPPNYQQDSQRAPQPYPPKAGPARHPVDRLVTILLLAFGLLNVALNLPGFFDLSATVSATMERMGMGTFSGNSLAGTLGIVLAVAYVAGWIVAAVLSVLSLRRGRVSFWIPLGMGVLMSILTTVVVVILVVSDPAFLQYVNRNS